MDSMDDAVRVILHGRVQGVGLRYTIAMEAREKGVRGYVENKTGGTVEACFVGEKDDVAAMVEFCRSGPGYADITRVDVETVDLGVAHGDDFEIRR